MPDGKGNTTKKEQLVSMLLKRFSQQKITKIMKRSPAKREKISQSVVLQTKDYYIQHVNNLKNLSQFCP